MKISKIPLGRAKGYLLVFIVVELSMLLASIFSLYPEEMLADPIMNLFTNSIFLSGALASSAWLWFNPNLLVADKKVVNNAYRPSSGTRYLLLAHIGNILMISGLAYGYLTLP